MPMKCNYKPAFTLVEVLATILLISIVLPVTMQGISMCTRMANHSKRQIEAVYLARTKLSELITSGQWENSAHSGNFQDRWSDYQWKLDVSEWNIDSVYQLNLQVSWDPDTQLETRSVFLSTFIYKADE
jgi:prepilin-type N-terminal cleavage/methylation domain-containing protein